jgi:hypothetical protein
MPLRGNEKIYPVETPNGNGFYIRRLSTRPPPSSHHPIIDHPATMQISLFLKNKHTLMGIKKKTWQGSK